MATNEAILDSLGVGPNWTTIVTTYHANGTEAQQSIE